MPDVINTTEHKLLLREEYETAKKKYGPAPSMMELCRNKQCIFYFGANHSRDIKNSQYDQLRGFWLKFLETTGATTDNLRKDSCIVLVEGSTRKLYDSEEEAITNGSEGNFITLLSHKAGIQCICPDITLDEFSRFQADFKAEELLLHRFLLWVNGYQKYADPKPDFVIEFNEWATRQTKKKSLDIEMAKLGQSLSLGIIKKLYKNVIGRDFSELESQNDYTNPNKNLTIINKIASDFSDLRDKKIVGEIERYWKDDKSIFIVFGQGHLIMQEPALRLITAMSDNINPTRSPGVHDRFQ